jgi:hypothetical protein
MFCSIIWAQPQPDASSNYYTGWGCSEAFQDGGIHWPYCPYRYYIDASRAIVRLYVVLMLRSKIYLEFWYSHPWPVGLVSISFCSLMDGHESILWTQKTCQSLSFLIFKINEYLLLCPYILISQALYFLQILVNSVCDLEISFFSFSYI